MIATLRRALCLGKKDTDLACYTCNSDVHRPIMTIFGKTVAGGVRFQIVIHFHLPQLISLHYIGKRELQKLRVFT